MPVVHQIQPSQVSCPCRVCRRRCSKVAWAIISLSAKRRDALITNGNHILVHGNFPGGTAKHLNCGPWLSFSSWLCCWTAWGQLYGFPVPYLQHEHCMWRERGGLRKKQQRHCLKTKLKYYFLSFVLKSFMSAYLLK